MKDGGRKWKGEGRVHSDHPRTTLWMGCSPREGRRDEVRTEREKSKRKKGNSYIHHCLMPAVRLCNYSPLSLACFCSFAPSSRPPPPLSPHHSLLFFLYPSLCPLPADLCQPPWNHRHIRAFNGHCLASCSVQTYYSLVAHAHVSVVCMCFTQFLDAQLQRFSIYYGLGEIFHSCKTATCHCGSK